MTTCSDQGDTHRARRLLEPEPQTESGDRKAFTASHPPQVARSFLNSTAEVVVLILADRLLENGRSCLNSPCGSGSGVLNIRCICTAVNTAAVAPPPLITTLSSMLNSACINVP
ncbi:hypothetical protein CGBL_0123750 [Corynebacterium glutamicum]|nr:hypothetical protein CGBL_0123750 [Corynebacterium glutamicum]